MSKNLWHHHDDGFVGRHTHTIRIGEWRGPKLEHDHTDEPAVHVVTIGDWRHKPPKLAVGDLVELYDEDEAENVDDGRVDDGGVTLDVQSTRVASRGIFRRLFGSADG